MVFILRLCAAFAASSIVTLANAQLDVAAKAKGLKYFGSATDNGELSDIPYITQLNNTADFGQITPGNAQKWDSTEPKQNEFSFAKGDVVANLAKANGQLLRCHTLVWHQQLPSWLTSGTWTNETLVAVLKTHISSVVGHYKNQCYAWDVVNEGLFDNGTYRDSIFYKTIGEAYLPIAFKAAAAADPTAKLYYNDYNIESPGSKSTAAQNIVKLIKSYGAKIDGIGEQAHLIVGSTPGQSSQAQNIAAFVALGVEVAITELDIRMTLPVTDALLAQQAKDYAATVGACVQEGCVGITIWDWTDKYSWVPSTFSGQGAALPWDENFQKKPAYNSILTALGGTAGSVSSSIATVSKTSSIPSSSTSSRTSAVSSATSSSPPTTTGVSQWGQCGGNNWTGSKTCVSPYTCHFVNDWYSQCY